MSTLSADNYTGQSATNTIKFAGTTFVGGDSDGVLTITGEGGSTKTNLQQGLTKAWINFNGTGTIATRDSFNVTTITDDATGRYTITIANDMSSTDYANFGGGCVNSSANNQQARQGPAVNNNATGSFQMHCGSNTYAQDDWEFPTAQVSGDLA
tara:strand:- start:153 stop:614 length:462 start_codon:yes stop_codon:yes gene_type:complete